MIFYDDPEECSHILEDYCRQCASAWMRKEYGIPRKARKART